MGKITMIKLFLSVIVCLSAGFIGSLFTRSSLGTWYAQLKKPSFSAPSWVFAPAWTILYILMGVAAYLIWKKGLDIKKVRIALCVFILQLVLNTAWSPVFFGMRSPLAGLVIIILLWFAIVATMILFFRISRPAAVLLIPYIAWVSFALTLNAAIVRLNP